MQPSKQDIIAILSQHKLYLEGTPGGERANLSGANLTHAYLTDADLSGANMTDARRTTA